MVNHFAAGQGEPLRVLQCAPMRWPGGIPSAVANLCLGLRDLGHEVALFHDGPDVGALEARGVQCHAAELGEQRPGPILRSTLSLRALVQRFRPHVVHVHGRSVALRCVLSGRTADWFTLHSTQESSAPAFVHTGLVRRHLSPLARNVIVLDESARPWIQHAFGVDPRAVVVVHNGVSCTRYREPTAEERAAARQVFGVGEGQTLVIFVGRMDDNKQPRALVAAARRARAEGRTDLRFALIGDGELGAAIEAEIAESGVGHLCRKYPWSETVQHYFAADLLVLPSRSEGFGLVAAEAMATGCPVLRTRTGGWEQMIIEGITGYSCDTDLTAVEKAIFEAVADPAHLRAMRKPARRWAAAHLSLDRHVAETVAQYRARLPA